MHYGRNTHADYYQWVHTDALPPILLGVGGFFAFSHSLFSITFQLY